MMHSIEEVLRMLNNEEEAEDFNPPRKIKSIGTYLVLLLRKGSSPNGYVTVERSSFEDEDLYDTLYLYKDTMEEYGVVLEGEKASTSIKPILVIEPDTNLEEEIEKFSNYHAVFVNYPNVGDKDITDNVKEVERLLGYTVVSLQSRHVRRINREIKSDLEEMGMRILDLTDEAIIMSGYSKSGERQKLLEYVRGTLDRRINTVLSEGVIPFVDSKASDRYILNLMTSYLYSKGVVLESNLQFDSMTAALSSASARGEDSSLYSKIRMHKGHPDIAVYMTDNVPMILLTSPAKGFEDSRIVTLNAVPIEDAMGVSQIGTKDWENPKVFKYDVRAIENLKSASNYFGLLTKNIDEFKENQGKFFKAVESLDQIAIATESLVRVQDCVVFSRGDMTYLGYSIEGVNVKRQCLSIPYMNIKAKPTVMELDEEDFDNIYSLSIMSDYVINLQDPGSLLHRTVALLVEKYNELHGEPPQLTALEFNDVDDEVDYLAVLYGGMEGDLFISRLYGEEDEEKEVDIYSVLVTSYTQKVFFKEHLVKLLNRFGAKKVRSFNYVSCAGGYALGVSDPLRLTGETLRSV